MSGKVVRVEGKWLLWTLLDERVDFIDGLRDQGR